MSSVTKLRQPAPALNQNPSSSMHRIDALDMVSAPQEQVAAILEAIFIGLSSTEPTQKALKKAICAPQELLDQAEVAVVQLELFGSELEHK